MATGSLTLPVAIVLAALTWAAAEIGCDHLLKWQSLGGLAAMAFMAYSLIEVNTIHSFIRTRTSFHSSLFLLLYSAMPFLYVYGYDYTVTCLFLVMLGMLFACFENKSASRPVFNSFLALGVITLIDPYFIWLAPVMYLMLGYMRSLGGRTFFAGLMGLLLPYWVLLGYAAMTGDYSVIIPRIGAFLNFAPLDYGVLDVGRVFSWGVVLILSVVSCIHTYSSSYKEKVHTRLMLHVVIFAQLAVNVMLVAQPGHFSSLMSVQTLLCAITSGYMFSLSFTPVTRVFAFFATALWLVMCGFNLWTLFSNC